MSRIADIPGHLKWHQRASKRTFDVLVAGSSLVLLSPFLGLAVLLASINTKEWGVFSQVRVGRFGKPVRVHKIRTMKSSSSLVTTVTTAKDPRITVFGAFLRRYKLDELPQLWDVFVGTMSLVGPRPDVPGWADCLEGEDRIILSVRPGITGPASVFFRDEETILAEVSDPEMFNRQTIWPKKVEMNREYVQLWSWRRDLVLILSTFSKRL